MKKFAIEYPKYLAFLLSKPNDFTMFAMEDPVDDWIWYGLVQIARKVI